MSDPGDLLPLPAGIVDLDRMFARFIAQFRGGDDPLVVHAVTRLSHAVRAGHLCLDLAKAPPECGAWPPLPEWREALLSCNAVGKPGSPNPPPAVPLILDAKGRLYLHRYYGYEQRLAAALKRRATPGCGPAGEGQEAAVATALAHPLTVISGGPGTGKTTTVVQILAALLEQWESEKPGVPFRIVLAAPTGKAAARLDEAVREGCRKLERPAIAERLATLPRARTLDRLLGSRPGTTALRHHAENPLPLDLLVIDEASMVSLPLMAKLFDALPARARVVLLGDRDQLASVAPGSVLADLAEAAGQPENPLHGSLVMLRKNYRFGNESAIYRACEAIRTGEGEAALGIIEEQNPQVSGVPLPAAKEMAAFLRERLLAGYGAYLAESDPARALQAFSRFRILAALRRGPFGVEELNRQAEKILREAGLIRGGPRLAAGLPLLVTRNDYQLNLFNGDIGILLPDPGEPPPADGAEKPLWAWFPGENADAPPRRVSPARLPEHEPAFAMTVHKSQGSEFGRVVLILPDRDAPVVTRELVYTGLTRAREQVELWFNPALLSLAIARRAERDSGLKDALTSRFPSP